jgi:integrase
VSQPRALAPEDRKRIIATANEWASVVPRSFTALRTRAFLAVALSSGLRVRELCNLNLDQVLDRTERGWRVRSQAYLRVKQSKGRRKGKRRWNSAGSFYLSKVARVTLRAYLREARRRGWMQWPPQEDAPLFITVKGRGSDGHGPNHHTRLTPRTAQHAWTELQLRARIPKRRTYGVHCLRHEFMTRIAAACGGNVFKVASAGRCDIRTAQRYVHISPAELEQLAEDAQRAPASAYMRRSRTARSQKLLPRDF